MTKEDIYAIHELMELKDHLITLQEACSPLSKYHAKLSLFSDSYDRSHSEYNLMHHEGTLFSNVMKREAYRCIGDMIKDTETKLNKYKVEYY